jgi:hypothetical protein
MKTINFKKTAKFSVMLLAIAIAFVACKQDPIMPPKDGGGIVIDDPKDDGKGKPPIKEDPVNDDLPQDPSNPDQCSFEGQLFHPIDGCKWAIKTSDGEWLYPINQDKLAGLGEGDKVKFGYVYRHEAFTNCMAGWNIELKCLTVSVAQ